MEVAEKKKKMMQQLPNDAIIEILSWLPAKFLLRLRWTCKFLFNLITNRDDFIKMHHHHSTIPISPPSVLSFCFMNRSGSNAGKLCQGYYYLNYKDTKPPHVLLKRDVSSEAKLIEHPSEFKHFDTILGSSNGLMLLTNNCSVPKKKYCWCILNPCTKEYKLIPNPHPCTAKSFILLVETYGFGYDQTIDDYKVIRVVVYYADFVIYSNVEVYTLGKDSWRSIGSCPYQLSSSCGVFMNGAIYWMDFNHENIISFDIGKEKFQYMAKMAKRPKSVGNHVNWSKLQVFEGSLCVILLKTGSHENNNFAAEIWVMKNIHTMNNNYCNESSLWDKLLTIPDTPYFPIKALRYIGNGEILMLNYQQDLVLYDLKDNSHSKTLSRIHEDCNKGAVLEVYTESLVSLNSGIYTGQEQTKTIAILKLLVGFMRTAMGVQKFIQKALYL